MTLYQIIALACIQGITEFLPVSSSGHLAIISRLGHWQDQGLAMDVALHLGTLGAVVYYFKQDIWNLILAFLNLFKLKTTDHSQELYYLILATIPAICVGCTLSLLDVRLAQSLPLIGSMTLIFGFILYIADQRIENLKKPMLMTWRSALIIGLSQVLAFIPGVSRSGICITAAGFLGLTRLEATRFAFLLSIPTILGATAMTSFKMYRNNQTFLSKPNFMAMIIAFLIGLMTISFIFKWIQRFSFKPFVVYRVFLGITIIVFYYL